MSYITPTDMLTLFEEQELIEATNLHSPAATEINQAKLQAACDGATGIIDGYLILRYELPLTDPPSHLLETLKIHGSNIARYLIEASSKEVSDKYESSIKWLEIFSAGSGYGGVGGDTTPGVSPQERLGSINHSIQPSFWNSETVSRIF